jgi:hypothetical protein
MHDHANGEYNDSLQQSKAVPVLPQLKVVELAIVPVNTIFLFFCKDTANNGQAVAEEK